MIRKFTDILNPLTLQYCDEQVQKAFEKDYKNHMKELNYVAGIVLIFIQVPWIVYSYTIGNHLIANLRIGNKISYFLH